MKRKILATALISCALVAAPISAQAHTGDMEVTAVCNTATGEYDFTVNLTISQTGLAGSTSWKVGTSSFTGTPSSALGMNRGPVASSGAGTIRLGSFSLPGSTTGLGPWVYAYTKWSDDYGKGSDGQLRAPLAGDCVRDVPEKPEPRAYSDAGETFTCEAWTYWTKTGFYDLTFDKVANKWTEDANPTTTKETSQTASTTYEERQARGCGPELAQTGVNGNAWWFGGGALLLIAIGASLVAYRNRPRGAHRA